MNIFKDNFCAVQKQDTSDHAAMPYESSDTCLTIATEGHEPEISANSAIEDEPTCAICFDDISTKVCLAFRRFNYMILFIWSELSRKKSRS